MKVIKYDDVAPVQELPKVQKRVVVGSDDGAPNFIMRVFSIEPGGSTPYHTHAWEHEIYILEGKGAAVSVKGETPVSRDSVVYVPPQEEHCIKNTGDKLMRMICVIPKVD